MYLVVREETKKLTYECRDQHLPAFNIFFSKLALILLSAIDIRQSSLVTIYH